MIKAFILLAITICAVSAQVDGNLRESRKFNLIEVRNKLSLIRKELKSTSIADNVVAVMDGFFTTIGFYAEAPAFEQCKTQYFGLIVDAAAVIEDGLTGNIFAIAKDIARLGQEAYDIYFHCNTTATTNQIAQSFKDAIAVFSQPDYIKKVKETIEKNTFAIMGDIQGMYNELIAGNYNNFGKKLGSLLRLVLVPQ